LTKHISTAFEKFGDYMTSQNVCDITKGYLKRLALTAAINTPVPYIPQKLGERFQSKLQSVADVKDLELKAFDMVFPELSDFENDKDGLCAFLGRSYQYSSLFTALVMYTVSRS
jgi:hypothetical protein